MLSTEKYQRYGLQANGYDLLKFFALICMTFDHIGMYWYPDLLWLRVVGRLAFPVFFFLVGYSGHFAIRKDLVIVAIACAILTVITFQPFFPLNALFAVMVARLLLPVIIKKQWLQTQPIMLLIACTLFLPVMLPLLEYSTLAILIACIGYIVRQKLRRWDHVVFYLATILLYIAVQHLWFTFDLAQTVVHAVLVAGLFAGLACFNHERPVPVLPKGLNGVVLLGSRYSLYYYLLHKIIIQAIDVMVFMQASDYVYRLFD